MCIFKSDFKINQTNNVVDDDDHDQDDEILTEMADC